jgi:hypothetical protein
MPTEFVTGAIAAMLAPGPLSNEAPGTPHRQSNLYSAAHAAIDPERAAAVLGTDAGARAVADALRDALARRHSVFRMTGEVVSAAPGASWWGEVSPGGRSLRWVWDAEGDDSELDAAVAALDLAPGQVCRGESWETVGKRGLDEGYAFTGPHPDGGGWPSLIFFFFFF